MKNVGVATIAATLFATAAAGGETVVYDERTKPTEVSTTAGAWCAKVDSDLSDCGEVTLEISEPVKPGMRFQVQFLNDGAPGGCIDGIYPHLAPVLMTDEERAKLQSDVDACRINPW